ncbi:hypothetical protein N7520_000948 [Penicillium odoratum]|uniref:uncharacterized protein n=1 Tax=Penicillium odoratum TaxID=1167516 RepID=UPI0025479EBA|nr:uncharacterized protein N7520_000948 [Penicillium odoratum]KAJ5777702.1 hypothetical protein N7520_000948 [Penicillium odoratum]
MTSPVNVKLDDVIIVEDVMLLGGRDQLRPEFDEIMKKYQTRSIFEFSHWIVVPNGGTSRDCSVN